MNYGKISMERKQHELVSVSRKLGHKAGNTALHLFLIGMVVFIVMSFTAVYGIFKGIIDNAPSIDTINIMPSGFITNIYDSSGNRTQKLVGSDANRIYKTIDQIPKCVQDAFIAIEDERYWTHNGIDIQGIFRAFYTGIVNRKFSQGASTITQQLLKNQVFEGGNEDTFSASLQRKIQEQYLAIQLEKKYSKEQILEYYLNTINLGQNTLGVQAASKRYFDKDVSRLSISEASVIASITKSPTEYNPITNPEANKERRGYVLDNMRKQGLITEDEYNEALEDDVYSRIQNVNNKQTKSSSSTFSYFTDEVITQVVEDLQEELGYSSTQAYNLIYRGGLSIYSTQDSKMQKICDEVLNDPGMYSAVPLQYELVYRITLVDEEGNDHNYDENMLYNYFNKQNPSFSLYFSDEESARPYVKRYKKHLLKTTGYTLESENMSLTLEPQVSFVIMDHTSGEVKAIVGGRGEKSANLSFDRATDSTRQPGSTFKVLSTYLPALDTKGLTLASVVDDAEFNYPGTETPVRNWDGEVYKGMTTFREGIYHSMNIVTVKALELVSPQTAYSYLLKLGFTTIVDSQTDKDGKVYTDIGYPMALGGLTNGITNLEITAAYASIANGGVYNKPRFYTKVLDHDGNVILDNTPESSRVMKETTAFLLTNAMEDVVTVTGATGLRAHFLNTELPVAGKTGTTTDNVDAWFVGYTPYLTAGVWFGYDHNRTLENTSMHLDLWRTIMEEIQKDYEVKDFTMPDSIVTRTICTKCGKLAVSGLCDCEIGGNRMRTEYFASGTEPTENCSCHVRVQVCASSNMKPSEYCPKDKVISRVFFTKSENSYTQDNAYMLPYGFESSVCNVHTSKPKDDEKDKPGNGEEGGNNGTNTDSGEGDEETGSNGEGDEETIPSGESPADTEPDYTEGNSG